MPHIFPMKDKSSQTCFIVDLYNKYRDKDRARQIFQLNGRWWAILEVELEWGEPVLDRVDGEDDFSFYHLYNTLEEAQEYVKQIRRFEGIKF